MEDRLLQHFRAVSKMREVVAEQQREAEVKSEEARNIFIRDRWCQYVVEAEEARQRAAMGKMKAELQHVMTAEPGLQLVLAVQSNHPLLLQLLLEAGANPNQPSPQDGVTPLTAACLGGNLTMVQLLLKAGARINATSTEDCWTPLMVAADKGHYQIVKCLLEHKANANLALLSNGMTAVTMAATRQHTAIVELLVKSGGADPNKARVDGGTALMVASNQGNRELVLSLLDAKAEPNQTSDNGTCAILAAAHKSNYQVMCTLLHWGAIPDLKRGEERALTVTICKDNGIDDGGMAEKLLDHGAESFSLNEFKKLSPSNCTRDKVALLLVVALEKVPRPQIWPSEWQILADRFPGVRDLAQNARKRVDKEHDVIHSATGEHLYRDLSNIVYSYARTTRFRTILQLEQEMIEQEENHINQQTKKRKAHQVRGLSKFGIEQKKARHQEAL